MSSTPWPYTGRRRSPRPDQPPAEMRLASRRLRRPSGDVVEVVGIGTLAAALQKTPRTLRRWEQQGFLPPTPFVTPVRGGAPRRVFTLAQLDGIVRIAIEEGLVGRKPFLLSSTLFTERVRALQDDLFAR